MFCSPENYYSSICVFLSFCRYVVENWYLLILVVFFVVFNTSDH